ncbi:MAG: hypothetical protein HFJ89_05115 [Oscillospiraceae bacterium]|jgi:hypothetical protein|nr:hypothetical protein [Oscillospiraceae bacterium]
MNITSMSNRELYKTLTGYDYPHGSSGGWTELNETANGENIDFSKAVDTAKLQEMKIGGNLSKIKASDRFERSDSIVFVELQAGNSEKSSDRFEYANDIDFNDKNVWRIVSSKAIIELGRGIEGGVPTKERIAEYYGNMAKRLDVAYANGKFTKEEYDYLNEGIAERMEHSTACAEDTAARRAVGHKNSMSFSSFEKRMSMTREERKADLKAEINEYIEKYFKIDRTSLLAMFNAVRYGK